MQPSRKGSTQMSHPGATVPFGVGAQRKGSISRQLSAVSGELEFPNAGTALFPPLLPSHLLPTLTPSLGYIR